MNNDPTRYPLTIFVSPEKIGYHIQSVSKIFTFVPKNVWHKQLPLLPTFGAPENNYNKKIFTTMFKK